MRWSGKLVLSSVIGVAALLGFSGAAHALYGRPPDVTYFTGNTYPAGLDWVLVPTPVANFDGLGPNCDVSCNMSASEFLNNLQLRLNDSASTFDQGRAAALIDIMLGQPGTNFGSIAAGVNYAQTHFNQFRNIINIYDSGAVPGYSVNWNQFMFFGAGTNSNGITSVNFDPSIEDCDHGQGCVGDIEANAGFDSPGFDWAVVFYSPGGKQFMIKHKCGNLTGDTDFLPIPTTGVTLQKSSNAPAGMSVGQDMTYTISASETSVRMPLSELTITDPIPAQFKYLGPAPGTPAPTMNGNTATWTFVSPRDDAILTQVENGVLPLTIDVQAVASATNIVNIASGSAIDQLGNDVNVTPGQTVNTVVDASRTPALVGQNSDVQAGGGLCLSAQSSGSVQGSPGANDNGQYVVSAGPQRGTINDFASHGGSVGNLNLGRNGAYFEVCRPDLVTVARNYIVDGGTNFTSLPGGTNYDISNWSGLYYINGSAGIYGTVNHTLTIVSTAGDLTIVKPITLSSARSSPRSTPSLGIIATNDIDIDASVTQVDAYLFADGTIQTCVVDASTCSTPALVVRGFLMARYIKFQRLGPLNSLGSPIAEQIDFNPQLYLNPPQFFDSGVDQKFLQGLGEKQPLF